ncbi:helix-turn-helix domain-containing protein [Cellulomonas sp. Leaf395]|uniref:helix-turn-helix domain-containing protein n=1 Tax=Cellulomonas sp. Leaf395 TaxID=1736362 RepID=UPI0009EA2A58|nr:helix-turn-helix domain-containing protein [Cellulomonas sp. Leaf395]
MEPEALGDLMTTGEVAAMLRTSENTLRWWRYNGRGPTSFLVGRHVRYLRADVERWVRDQRDAC